MFFFFTYNNKYYSDLQSNYKPITVPVKLPIIVKPKPYEKNIFAGYLLNNELDIEPIIIPLSAYKESSIIVETKEKIIYKSVNGFSSVPCKINNDVLNFLINNYDKHNLFDYFHTIDELESLEKMT